MFSFAWQVYFDKGSDGVRVANLKPAEPDRFRRPQSQSWMNTCDYLKILNMKMTEAQAGRALLLAVAVGIAGVEAGGTPQTAPARVSTASQGGLRGGAIPSIQGYRLGEIGSSELKSFLAR